MNSKADTNILEYMAITDTEISIRKQLLRFSMTDAQILGQFRTQLLEKTDYMAHEFIKSISSIRAFSRFAAGDMPSHILDLLKTYVSMFFGGVYGKDYVKNRLEIGIACRANGIEPKFFHAAVKILKDIIFETVRNTVKDRILDDFVVDAIDKLLVFDVSLASDAYINSPFITKVESPDLNHENLRSKPDSEKINNKNGKASIAANPFATAFFQLAEQNKKLRSAMKKESVNNPFALAYFKVAARQHELMQLNELRKKQMNPLALAYFKAVNQNKDLKKKVAKDTVTGLYSQDVFRDFLKRNISYSKRISYPISIACMQIEDYEQFLDAEGPSRSEEAIAFIGAMLQEVIRDVDLASRSEGRFYVVFPGTTGENAMICCKRIVECFSSVYGRRLIMGIADTGPDNFVQTETFMEMAMNNMLETAQVPRAVSEDDLFQEVEIT